MADTLGTVLERPILLTEMIQELRMQLQASMNAARDQELRFAVKEVELELQVAVSRETTGGAGLKFWVVDTKGEHKAATQTTHTFKLTLEPVPAGAPGELVPGTALVMDELSEKPE